MRLAPREIEKLMLHNAGFLAQKRYARGLKLNYVESIALISSQLLEFIREGNSVADLMEKGKKLLGLDDVMSGVAEMIHEVQVEGTFPDGTKLVTVHDPICDETGNAELALYGSGLTYAPIVTNPDNESAPLPAETFIADGDIELNAGRRTVDLTVLNTGDRPIQVGSHYPFVEANRALSFNRKYAYGMRLDIPAGTAVRFEPGESKTVALVEIAGKKIIKGGSGIVSGPIENADLDMVVSSLTKAGFTHVE